MNWIVLLLLISFPLGHLTRIRLGSSVFFYPHDVLAILIIFRTFLLAARKKRLPEGKLTAPIVGFTLICLVSLIAGSGAVQGWEAIIGGLYLLRWLALTGVYFLVKEALQKRETLAFFGRKYPAGHLLLMSGLVLTSLGLLQYVLAPDLRQLKWLGWDDHYYRLAGTILDPGFTGMLLVLTFYLAASTKLDRLTKLVSTVLPLIALLLTYSRSSYLAFFAGGLVYVSIKKKLRIGAALAGIFLSVLLFLPRPSGEGVNLLRVYSISSRVKTWQNALLIAQDRPFFGVGFNLLRYAQRDYGFLDDKWEQSHSAAGIDNAFLFVLATVGLVGLSFFLWLLYAMGKISVNNTLSLNKKASLLASISAVSVHSLFNNTWFYPWVMIWVWYLLAEAEVHR